MVGLSDEVFDMVFGLMLTSGGESGKALKVPKSTCEYPGWGTQSLIWSALDMLGVIEIQHSIIGWWKGWGATMAQRTCLPLGSCPNIQICTTERCWQCPLSLNQLVCIRCWTTSSRIHAWIWTGLHWWWQLCTTKLVLLLLSMQGQLLRWVLSMLIACFEDIKLNHKIG